jgi:two-component system, NtrC family, response regulator AtoC
MGSGFRKTVDIQQSDKTVLKAFQESATGRNEDAFEKPKLEHEDTIIGNYGNNEISNFLNLAASATSPVLITGETGTGKNLLARMIHLKSSLNKAPFVGINCAALPETLIEAELFGYEKGAFTSAVVSRKGILEMANGGTLFLDEIADIPLHLQSKLLNVLEEKTIRRIGGSVIKLLDFRIIASTSATLENVLGSTFRRDLYYRLNVLRIHLPPLRQRPDDIPQLCRYFLKTMNGRETLIPDAELEILTKYDWPGNVRELRNVLERAYVFKKDNFLRPSEILIHNQQTSQSWDGKSERRKIDRRKPSTSTYETQSKTLADIEKDHIKIGLQEMHGNITKTAKSLGISLSTLKRKIKEYGLKCCISFITSILTDYCDLWELISSVTEIV